MSSQPHYPRNPRILIVTPEVTCLPQSMGSVSRSVFSRAGGLGDICATQIHALHERGMDVHLATPNYRNVFKSNSHHMPCIDIHSRRSGLWDSCIHLAEDRSFYYHSKLFLDTGWKNIRIALSFQREVINHIIPEVQPDLIHCYGWMTGLIPAMARHHGIPCVFTLYNLDSPRLLLSTIENEGVDAASFWQECYFSRMPVNYEETRDTNPVDVLTSAVFAAQYTHTLSQSFLSLLIDDNNHQVSACLRTELQNKLKEGDLGAITAMPDSSFDPSSDQALLRLYGPDTHHAGKLFNKLHLQETLKLTMDSTAPVCFWPTRLDDARPGCHLMAELLECILERYRSHGLQIVFVADGDFQETIRALVGRLQVSDRVAVCDFDARRYRLAYAGADFVLMPMYLDPCALPCKIGQRYGALPIGHDAGAIHDCVEHLNIRANQGTGFLFNNFDAKAFLWAIDQAMAFFDQPLEVRSNQVKRIMSESLLRHDPGNMVQQTVDLYERILNRSLVQLNEDVDMTVPLQKTA